MVGLASNNQEHKSVLGDAHVRVTGMRLGKFVEFEFWINDEDLMIELILPPAAFAEFCVKQNALVHTSEADGQMLEELEWRLKQPGLLRKIGKSED